MAIPREALVTDEEPAVRRHVPQPVTPAAPQEFSRWRKTDTSFGPFGRLLITFVMVMIGALFVWSMNPFAFVPWLVIAMPLVLRSVWAKKRVI